MSTTEKDKNTKQLRQKDNDQKAKTEKDKNLKRQ
jgi:hypothetical protein